MLYADQIIRYAQQDPFTFITKWVLDVSFVVTFAPTLYSFYESTFFAAVARRNAFEHPITRLYLSAEPVISASLHIFSYAVAVIMFDVQNGLFAAYLIATHNSVHFDSIVTFYTCFALLVCAAYSIFALKGCMMGPDQLQKYSKENKDRWEKRIPPNIALTYMRFSLGGIAFFMNPLYQYVSYATSSHS